MTRDFAFAYYAANELGVVCIPCSPYYEDKEIGSRLVRWAFCKTSETIEEVEKRLKWKWDIYWIQQHSSFFLFFWNPILLYNYLSSSSSFR